MPAPLSAVPSPLPPESILPPESAQGKIRNAMLILRANTHVILDNAFQPIGAYHRVMQLLDNAVEQLERTPAHVCAPPAGLSQALNSGDGVYRP